MKNSFRISRFVISLAALTAAACAAAPEPAPTSTAAPQAETSPLPTPTAMPPTETATTEPTATAEPTATPDPTATDPPTATPHPLAVEIAGAYSAVQEDALGDITWHLSLTPAGRITMFSTRGEVLGQTFAGSYTVLDESTILMDFEGLWSCTEPGSYRAVRQGSVLSLTQQEDNCQGRANFFSFIANTTGWSVNE